MSIESKEAVAIGNLDMMESICHTCAYRGCTNCPSLVPINGRNETKEDFPQITSATELINGKIIVHSCDYYSRVSKEKTKGQRAQFVWDSRQKKHVKVIK